MDTSEILENDYTGPSLGISIGFNSPQTNQKSFKFGTTIEDNKTGSQPPYHANGLLNDSSVHYNGY